MRLRKLKTEDLNCDELEPQTAIIETVKLNKFR
jgi:hypothetical protein